MESPAEAQLSRVHTRQHRRRQEILLLVVILRAVKGSAHDISLRRLLEVASRGTDKHFSGRETQQLATRVGFSLQLLVGLETYLARRHGRRERVIIQLGPQEVLLDGSRDYFLVLPESAAVLLDLRRIIHAQEVCLLVQQVRPLDLALVHTRRGSLQLVFWPHLGHRARAMHRGNANVRVVLLRRVQVRSLQIVHVDLLSVEGSVARVIHLQCN